MAFLTSQILLTAKASFQIHYVVCLCVLWRGYSCDSVPVSHEGIAPVQGPGIPKYSLNEADIQIHVTLFLYLMNGSGTWS